MPSVASHWRRNAPEHVLASCFRATRAAVRKEHFMLDIIMIAIGLGFFALSVGYTIACDRF